MAHLDRRPEDDDEERCEPAMPMGLEPEHKLCDTWCLYYDNPMDLPANPTDEQYKKNLKKVYSFNTIEQFWRLSNNMKTVEEMSLCNLHLFRNGVSPTWEDPVNENGGKWVCTVPITPDLWVKTVLSIIGGMYGKHQDEVCGAVAALKKQKRRDKLSLWLKTESNAEACKFIGRKWKEICGDHIGKIKIEFLPHKTAQKTRSSYFSSSKYQL